MAQEYKIKAVKAVPKEWDSKYGPMKTWLIQVEGNGEPIQLNKKADSPAPKVGDDLYGNIETTDFGQKFKSESKPFQGGFKGQPRDDSHIRAQWAISQSIAWQHLMKEPNFDIVEQIAKQLFAMVDRVKQGSPTAAEVSQNNDNESAEMRSLMNSLPSFDDDNWPN